MTFKNKRSIRSPSAFPLGRFGSPSSSAEYALANRAVKLHRDNGRPGKSGSSSARITGYLDGTTPFRAITTGTVTLVVPPVCGILNRSAARSV